MRSLFILFLTGTLLLSPVSALELTFTTDENLVAPKTLLVTERAPMTKKSARTTSEAIIRSRINKQVIFRGNKSVRFAEFENLDLASQLENAKSLLGGVVSGRNANVVNFAELPDINNQATAVKQVETKVTTRSANNPAITGYGRTRGNVYGALNLKRARDAKSEIALQEKLDQFQVTPRIMQEKLARSSQNQEVTN